MKLELEGSRVLQARVSSIQWTNEDRKPSAGFRRGLQLAVIQHMNQVSYKDFVIWRKGQET